MPTVVIAPKKRPSVDSKKTVRGASSQAGAGEERPASAFADTPEIHQNVFAPAASPASFPEVPDPPEARIPFAGDVSASSVEEPSDRFDLGDGYDDSYGAGEGANGASDAPFARSGSAARRRRTGADVRSSSGRRGARDDKGGRTTGRSTSRARGGKGAAKTGTKGSGARRIVLTIVAVVVVAALAAGAFFAWNTFLRYDDSADIQGEWRTQDGAMTVVIDDSSIRMPDLEYSYEIDTMAKSITFSFSDLTGSGTYGFSEDRTQLTIVEGEGEDAAATVLVKVSDDTQATPQLLADQETADDEASNDASAEDADSTDDASDTQSEEDGSAGQDS